jgi:hypothetical protein
MNGSWIYKLEWKAGNKSYVGQTGRSIEIRYREQTRYTNVNNLKSAYSLHILNNRHEYGNPEQTIQLLETCSKGKKINCWESFYMQVLQQQNYWSMSRRSMNPGQRKETTRHIARCNDPVLAWQAQWHHHQWVQSVFECIQYLHDIISTYPYLLQSHKRLKRRIYFIISLKQRLNKIVVYFNNFMELWF